MHSMVMQYLSDSERRAVMAQLAWAGGLGATRACPLVWIALEWKADRSEVILQLTQWQGGGGEATTQTIAACHPYGKWIEWCGLTRPYPVQSKARHRGCQPI